MRCIRMLFVVFSVTTAASAWCVDSWPGESWSASTDLTFLNPSGWSSNLSGAYWNPVTRRLWVANNSGNYSVLKEDGLGSFSIENTFSPSGDLEGITQADPAADRVYLIVERDCVIREYVASTGVLNQSWDITSLVGGMTDPNDGTEGIAFIPNAWLSASGFRDGSGNLYSQSVHGVNGLGGIMLVSVQDVARATAGYIYAVDVKNDGTWTTVGKYKTSRNESCDLAFDASIGRLYILHNIDGNLLEETDLTSAPFGSDRKFTTLREFQVPSGSNIEGFAITPALKSDNTLGDRWCFYTDDNNAQGALRWFKQLPSPIAVNAGNGQTAPVSTAVSVAPSVVVQDAFQNLLPNFAITFQVTGGGGSVSGGSTTTNSSGIATVGSWTLGATPGANSLSATGTGLSGNPLSFTATGTDVTPATVTSIARQTPSGAATNAGTVTWRVTFSEHVNNVSTADFTLVDVASSITSESITGVSASSGTTIDVTASTGSGDGTLRLDVLAATATITDDAANSLNANYTSGQTYSVDKTPPVVSIGAPSASTTGTGPISYTITYTGADSVTLANGNVTLNTTGTANGTVAVSGSGTASRTVTISSVTGDGTVGISLAANTASDNAGNQALAAGPSATFTVNSGAGPSNGLPTVTSPASASPTNVVVGQTVTFSVGASDPDGDPLSAVWDFGDGSPLSSSSSHIYSATGNYTATVTISDGKGGSMTSSTNVVVSGADTADIVDTDGDGIVNSADTDDDNDGVSDANEAADGTDSLSAASVQKTRMYLTKIKGSTRFAETGRDSVAVSGVIPNLPASFSPTGTVLRMDVGGALHTFELDAKGRAKTAEGSFQMKLKFKRNKATKQLEFLGGNAPFKATILHGSFAAAWKDEGVDPALDARKQKLSMNVHLQYNGRVYTASINALYSAKAGKTGMFAGANKIVIPK